MEELGGRVAVVTGAASGIGRALALRFAAEGMAVGIADVDEGGLEATATALRGQGAAVCAVPTDVARAEAVEAFARRAVEELGGVHVVCNNAGVGAGGPLWEIPLDDWRWVLGVNLWGVIHGIRSFVPRLVAQDEGHVVNTASLAGLISPGTMGPYNASKHAVVALSETLAQDLRAAGSAVGVSILCPGFVATRIWDAERARPTHLPPARVAGNPGERERMRAEAERFFAAQMAPEQVADAVVGAIRGRALYVLTHPGSERAVRRRAEAIGGGVPAPAGAPLA